MFQEMYNHFTNNKTSFCISNITFVIHIKLSCLVVSIKCLTCGIIDNVWFVISSVEDIAAGIGAIC